MVLVSPPAAALTHDRVGVSPPARMGTAKVMASSGARKTLRTVRHLKGIARHMAGFLVPDCR